MELKRTMLLVTCLSMTHAQGDAVKFQASLIDALPTIQAQMEILLKSFKDFYLSPEKPFYYIQNANDSVIVAELVKNFPKTFLLRYFQRVTDQPPRPLTEKREVLQNAFWDETSESREKVRSVLQNILDLFKNSTALETTYSDKEIRLAMQKDLSPEAMTAVLYSHFDSKTPTEVPIVIPGLSPMPSLEPEPEPSKITTQVPIESSELEFNVTSKTPTPEVTKNLPGPVDSSEAKPKAAGDTNNTDSDTQPSIYVGLTMGVLLIIFLCMYERRRIRLQTQNNRFPETPNESD